MGDPSTEVTDDMRENAQIAKSKATQAIAEGEAFFSPRDYVRASSLTDVLHYNLDCIGALDEALDHLTEAILLNPTSGILYSSRGRRLMAFLLLMPHTSFSGYISVTLAVGMF